MKNDLIWGWVFVILALVMVACIVYGIFIGNWSALPMCGFALGMNITSAITRFKSYKYRKSLYEFDQAFYACFKHQEDNPEDSNRITD